MALPTFRYMTQPFVVDFLLDCEESGLNDWREETHGQPLLQCPNASTLVILAGGCFAMRALHSSLMDASADACSAYFADGYVADGCFADACSSFTAHSEDRICCY